MGMPCEVNSIVKLSSADFPSRLAVGERYQAIKSGYRIFPLNVPLQLVDQDWQAHGDVVIQCLTWQNQTTEIQFAIVKIYPQPITMK
jgi:Protein of unknown function (DUF2584)